MLFILVGYSVINFLNDWDLTEHTVFVVRKIFYYSVIS
jgi:hypothetical protein